MSPNPTVWQAVERCCGEHRPLIICSTLFLFFAFALVLFVDGSLISLLLYFRVVVLLLALYITFVALGFLAWTWVVARPAELLEYLKKEIKIRFLGTDRWLGALIACVCIGFSLSSYTAVKSVLGEITQFGWDVRLMQADRFLHFGHHPWELIHEVLGYAGATAILDKIYESWFLILYFIFFWQAFSTKRKELRQRFLITFVLVWFLMGNLLAFLLASAGPCYFHYVVSDSTPYASLLAYLREVDSVSDLRALQLQNLLWTSHIGGETGLATGISAAPSIHVAMVTLLALFGFNVDKRLGVLLSVFAIAVFVGSIHLAWHYAIDGYLSVFGTCLIWTLSGKYLIYRERTKR